MVKRMFNVNEAASRCDLTNRAIRKACKSGSLRAERKSGGWLISADELIRWHSCKAAHKPGPKSFTAKGTDKSGNISSPKPGNRNKGKELLTKEERSRVMAAVPRKNTKPEMALRSILHKAGYRFRLHAVDLPGTPDIIMPKYRTAIFVHGCYWHRHEGCKKTTTPTQNREFWIDKFEKNIVRDERKKTELISLGWRVLTVWECDIADRSSELLRNIEKFLKEAR